MARPRLAVWKFSSCDGCQLSLLDCEDELLRIAGAVEISYFLEATRAVGERPYDVSLVEGSVTTEAEVARIRTIREISGKVVAIGACATAGGIQALRGLAGVAEFAALVYARPEHIATLADSTPISAHIDVDFELRGCPVDRGQLLEVLSALLIGREPRIPRYSVCQECRRRGTVCVMVAHGTPCLGPVTQAGCGAICPAYARGCFGCFGPRSRPNTAALSALLRRHGMGDRDVERVFSTFTTGAPEFAEAAAAARSARTGGAGSPGPEEAGDESP